MKRAMVLTALLALAVAPLFAGGSGTVSGTYVEARTAEVFTGGCIMGSEAEIQVSAPQVSLDISKHMIHDPSCGAMQWFHPLASVEKADMGLAAEHAFTGSGLGTKWSDPNRRSAFFGTFTY